VVLPAPHIIKNEAVLTLLLLNPLLEPGETIKAERGMGVGMSERLSTRLCALRLRKRMGYLYHNN